MRISRGAWGVVVCAALGAGQARAQEAAPEAAAAAKDPGAPSFITAVTDEEPPTLINGERGSFDLRLELPAPGHPNATGVTWAAGGEVRLNLAVPKTSGIGLLAGPEDTSEGGSSERLIRLPVPEALGAPTVVKIDYVTSSRARVKNRNIRIEVAAPVVTVSGERVNDVGTLRLPVRVETPLSTKIIVLVIIFIAIFLFVVEWVRVDVVAICMMVALPLLNLLSSKLAFTGLSSNAVIAIIGVMIVSAGLNKVGLVSRMVKPVINAAGSSASRLMIMLSAFIAVISSVMQNTGAAVLFLPGIRHACKTINTPISRILMPIGMCAILGGTLTMIGTSPLILLNDILPEGMEKFGLLELSPIGIGLVIGGIIFFSTFGRFFLAKIDTGQDALPEQQGNIYHEMDGPFEIHIPSAWEAKGGLTTVADVGRELQVNIVCLRDRTGAEQVAPSPDAELHPGMDIGVFGTKDAVEKFVDGQELRLVDTPRRFRRLFNPAVAGTVEAVVAPHSSMIGKTVREVNFRESFGLSAVALFQKGTTHYRDMSEIPLMSGDAVLLHGTWQHLQTLGEAHRNFIYSVPPEAEIQKPEKVTVGVICFLLTLTGMLVSSFYFQSLPYNPIPLSVCLMGGGVLMVLTGVLNIREAYGAVDWRTVFLLGGLIPLGMAVDRTGTAEWIATGVVTALGESVTPLVLLIVLSVLSGAFCLVISNVGACTLLVPLGVSMAIQIGIDPRVAAIAVGIGVSNSFLLPTHQVNALYMGPGGYRTKDYLKIGGIMSIIYIVVLVTMTYFFYL